MLKNMLETAREAEEAAARSVRDAHTEADSLREAARAECEAIHKKAVKKSADQREKALAALSASEDRADEDAVAAFERTAKDMDLELEAHSEALLKELRLLFGAG